MTYMEHAFDHETPHHAERYVHEHLHREDFMRLLSLDAIGERRQRLIASHEELYPAFERLQEASVRYVDQLVDMQDVLHRKQEAHDPALDEDFDKLVVLQSKTHDAVVALACDFETKARVHDAAFSWSQQEHPSRLFYAHLALFLAYETYAHTDAA